MKELQERLVNELRHVNDMGGVTGTAANDGLEQCVAVIADLLEKQCEFANKSQLVTRPLARVMVGCQRARAVWVGMRAQVDRAPYQDGDLWGQFESLEEMLIACVCNPDHLVVAEQIARLVAAGEVLHGIHNTLVGQSLAQGGSIPTLVSLKEVLTGEADELIWQYMDTHVQG
jgi:hypothetical protein